MPLFWLTTLAFFAAAARLIDPSHAGPPLSFESCAELRTYLATREPYENVHLAKRTYECSEPPVLSVDGLSVDFGGSLIRVADRALRPGIVIGDLHTPPDQRHQAITVRNLMVDGNRQNQGSECWDGPCDPALNDHPLREQRVNGVTVNGCDDCSLTNVKVTDARSGGLVVVSSEHLLVDGLQAERSHYDGFAAYHTRNSVFRNLRVRHNDYSGMSFDCDVAGNRIEGFEATDNGHHGIFIRHASENAFSRGSVKDNALDGVYFDRSRPDDLRTCATDTRMESVEIEGSGRYGAWLDFECDGNGFASSRLSDNGWGCFGGRSADLIGQSNDTECASRGRDVVEASILAQHQEPFQSEQWSCHYLPRGPVSEEVRHKVWP